MPLGNAYAGGGGGAGLVDISTSEQDTGQLWHNSKPIFSKTILIADPTNAGITTVAHSISDIEDVVRIEGTVELNSTPVDWLPLGFPAGTFDVRIECNLTNVIFTSGSAWTGGAGLDLTDVVATVFYTKT